MSNGIKKRLEDWETDDEFEEVVIGALLGIIEKLESKGIDWKIWGMFSIPIILIVLDKIL